MECTLADFTKRLASPWLWQVEGGALSLQIETAYQKAVALEKGSIILLTDENPVAFWSFFLGTLAAEQTIALFSPQAATREWEAALNLIKPALVIGSCPLPLPEAHISPAHASKILIPTGGTGGRLRFAIHSWDSLTAAVQGLAQAIEGPLSAVAPLPLHHVSGLMPGLRAFLTGGTIYSPTSKSFEAGDGWAQLPGALLSLVPTQLERLLKNQAGIQALQQARRIFLGGGSTRETLLQTAKNHALPISLTYGMTETGAMIALSDAHAFLKGNKPHGKALPHACILIGDETATSLKKQGEGRLWIEAPSLFQGYFPDKPMTQEPYLTGDTGSMNENGELSDIKRADRIIISGGEKIDPSFIETTLLKTGLFQEVHVMGESCPEWGTSLVAYGVWNGPETPDVAHLKALLKENLSRAYLPKRWFFLNALPRKENGKLDVQHLTTIKDN